MNVIDQVARVFSDTTMEELPQQLRLPEKQALSGAGFIQQVRMSAESGVTYDWMLKVIEWERERQKP